MAIWKRPLSKMLEWVDGIWMVDRIGYPLNCYDY